MRPNVQLPPIHDDVTVTSRLLRLIVSFRWAPFFDHHLMRDLSQWLASSTTGRHRREPSANYPPTFILIGIFSYFSIIRLYKRTVRLWNEHNRSRSTSPEGRRRPRLQTIRKPIASSSGARSPRVGSSSNNSSRRRLVQSVSSHRQSSLVPGAMCCRAKWTATTQWHETPFSSSSSS